MAVGLLEASMQRVYALLMFRIDFLLPNFVVSVRSCCLLFELFTSSC